MSSTTDQVVVQLDTHSSVVVHLHGATLISWKVNGEEVLFCSEKAIFDNKKAIRGGIPLVFPNFGPWSLGPQHGFARIKRWKLETEPYKTDDGRMTADFTLEDDEEIRAIWNAKFKVLYKVSLGTDALTLSLTVKNRGESSFDFTTLMHTYFRVPDITNTRVTGLKGCTYTDKVHGGDHEETRDMVQVDENYDRIYQKVAGPVKVLPDVNNGTTQVTVTTANLPDIVVWNPWIEKAKGMSDFGDDEYLTMLCVEAGSVTERVELAAGCEQHFSQTISYTTSKANM